MIFNLGTITIFLGLLFLISMILYLNKIKEKYEWIERARKLNERLTLMELER